MLLNNESKQGKQENWSERRSFAVDRPSSGNIINYDNDKRCLTVNVFFIDRMFCLLTELF